MNSGTSEFDRDQKAFHQLRLIRSTNIGPVSYVQMLRRFGSAEKALEAIPDLAQRGGGRAPKIADSRSIEKELSQIRALNAGMLFLDDRDYPYLLRELSNAPPVLIYRGHLSHLKKPTIAIVGARNASAAACRLARDIASSLNNKGASIVSGLARGIDTAAHEGSVQQSTIGVIAGGINVYYPRENQNLQEQIASDGLLLTEQPPGTEPQARHFPYRNRVIAGLAHGTVVVEAAPRSGSFITARLAAEAGRQVMAIPGSPLDPRARGCNNLIREGAILVQSADDIMEMIDHFDNRIATEQQEYENSTAGQNSSVREWDNDEATDFDRQNLYQLLSITPVSIDELVRQSRLAPSTVQLMLLELELAGKIQRHAGGKVSLKN